MRAKALILTVLCLSLVALSSVALAASAQYVGSEKCATCHAEQFENWQKTGHALIVQDASVVGEKGKDFKYLIADQYFVDKDGNYVPKEWNSATKSVEPSTRSGSWLQNCASCHTTGYDAKKLTFAEAGIGCESCHGPGSKHIKSFSAKDIICNPGNEMCTSCHGANRQGEQMGMMNEPGHLGIFEAALIERGDGYSDRCATCHSATVILAIQKGEKVPSVDEFRTGSLKNDRYGITCVVCHDPHKVTEYGGQLKTDSQTTCVQCHTATSNFQNPLPAGELFAKAPKHSQAEGLRGRGALGVTEGIATHSQATCADCHMTNGNHIFKVGTPEITLTPHGRETVFNSCVGCHSESIMTAERLATFQENNMQRVEALVAEYEAVKAKAAGNDNALAILEKANVNLGFVQSDGSKGVHNPEYFREVLTAAEVFIKEAKAAL